MLTASISASWVMRALLSGRTSTEAVCRVGRVSGILPAMRKFRWGHRRSRTGIPRITSSCNDGSVRWSGELRSLEELARLGKSPCTKYFLSCTNSLQGGCGKEKRPRAGKRNEFKNGEMDGYSDPSGNETVSGETIERWSSRTYFIQRVSRK